jgi:crotonobetainyl-CoA:carnitine CoA-transferase CaiB-like acyl-CoA transferase
LSLADNIFSAPLLGQHTRQILVRFGYTPEEIDDLIARGIAYQAKEGVA